MADTIYSEILDCHGHGSKKSLKKEDSAEVALQSTYIHTVHTQKPPIRVAALIIIELEINRSNWMRDHQLRKLKRKLHKW